MSMSNTNLLRIGKVSRPNKEGVDEYQSDMTRISVIKTQSKTWPSTPRFIKETANFVMVYQKMLDFGTATIMSEHLDFHVPIL